MVRAVIHPPGRYARRYRSVSGGGVGGPRKPVRRTAHRGHPPTRGPAGSRVRRGSGRSQWLGGTHPAASERDRRAFGSQEGVATRRSSARGSVGASRPRRFGSRRFDRILRPDDGATRDGHAGGGRRASVAGTASSIGDDGIGAIAPGDAEGHRGAAVRPGVRRVNGRRDAPGPRARSTGPVLRGDDRGGARAARR